MLRPYVPASLDAEQFRRPALGQRLQTSSSPQCRSPCDLVHQALFDADLARQVLDVRLGGEEAVGPPLHDEPVTPLGDDHPAGLPSRDRKSTRLNSSHLVISYAVFCLIKKKKSLLKCN